MQQCNQRPWLVRAHTSVCEWICLSASTMWMLLAQSYLNLIACNVFWAAHVKTTMRQVLFLLSASKTFGWVCFGAKAYFRPHFCVQQLDLRTAHQSMPQDQQTPHQLCSCRNSASTASRSMIGSFAHRESRKQASATTIFLIGQRHPAHRCGLVAAFSSFFCEQARCFLTDHKQVFSCKGTCWAPLEPVRISSPNRSRQSSTNVFWRRHNKAPTVESFASRSICSLGIADREALKRESNPATRLAMQRSIADSERTNRRSWLDQRNQPTGNPHAAILLHWLVNIA